MSVVTRNTQINTPQKIDISAYGLLVEKNLFDRLKFAYAVAPKRTARAFRKLGIDITNVSDLANIATLSANGDDKKGIKMASGKIIAFDAQNVVEKILSENDPGLGHLFTQAPIYFTDVQFIDGKPILIHS